AKTSFPWHLSAESASYDSPGQSDAEGGASPWVGAVIIRVPRPLWRQSAKLTGAKEAMEPMQGLPFLRLASQVVFF
ncbi:MAG: hypothetical protein ACOX9E_15860, partial [Lentisphaeria bacterium]